MTYEIHKFAKYVSAFLYYALWFFFLCGVVKENDIQYG